MNYSRKKFLLQSVSAGVSVALLNAGCQPAKKIAAVAGIKPDQGKRIGIIGLDTSHSTAFTEALNNTHANPDYKGYRIVAAYPHGSADIKSSTDRIPAYTEQVRKAGVQIVDSIEQLLDITDVILLETNDGRLHLEQAAMVMRAGKKIFIDKPLAASLTDILVIFSLAKKLNVPVFSSSSLRFATVTQEVANGKAVGRVLAADTFSPCDYEKTHPDFFWYGIHGIESLFTLMGPDCRDVSCVHAETMDVLTGVWSDDRIGTFRGLRSGKQGYGGTAFGEKGIVAAGMYDGYEVLLKKIIEFFDSGIAPVTPEQTIEIYTFMTAAGESKKNNSTRVRLADTFELANSIAINHQLLHQ